MYSYKDIEQYAIKNLNDILGNPKIKALIAERMSADYDGHKFVDAHGYDQVDKHGKRIETKYTCYVKPSGALRVSSLFNKRGKCDYVKIIDGVNNRTFVIPANVIFDKGNFYGTEFVWSSTYNMGDLIQYNNTQLLLKYEVRH